MAVWIVREPRYEHKKTIEWLNESTEKLFYLVTIEAIELEGSIAPLFTTVSEPSPAAKEIGEEKREPSERSILQERFWEELLEKSDAEFSLFHSISPKQQHWIGKGAGIGGVAYNYIITNEYGAVELYIDTKSSERNKKIFDRLIEDKEDIEAMFDHEFNWRRLDNKKASRVRVQLTETGLTDEDAWGSTQAAMVEGMQQFYRAFEDRI